MHSLNNDRTLSLALTEEEFASDNDKSRETLRKFLEVKGQTRNRLPKDPTQGMFYA